MREVAVGIIMKNGRFLACQRRCSAVYPLKWEFPGGKVEAGESAVAALRRELREELSIESSMEQEFFRQEWIYPEGVDDPQRDGAFRVLYFLVPSFIGEPSNNAFEQIRWVLSEELMGLDVLEGNREAIARLIQQAKGAITG